LPYYQVVESKKFLKCYLLCCPLVDDFQQYEFVIAGAPSQSLDFYKKIIGSKNVAFVDNKTYDLLSVSYAALVTSGTATLETALFKVPQVVCYKGSIISYQIAKRIITLRFISLVNLIMDKEVVKELIQKDFTKKNLTKELAMILDDTHRSKIFENYYQLEQKLGGKGASKNTATSIISKLN
jgi:lipid-A-disaccharide synthase